MKYINVMHTAATIDSYIAKQSFENVYDAINFCKRVITTVETKGYKVLVIDTDTQADSFGAQAVNYDFYVVDVNCLIHPLSYCTVSDAKYDDRYGMQKDPREAKAIADFTAWCEEKFAHICTNGFKVQTAKNSPEFRTCKVLTYTMSSIKEGKVVVVPEQNLDMLNSAIGINDSDFANQSFADMAKIQALAFAGQEPITNFGIELGMKNILVIENLEYDVLLKNVRTMGLDGRRKNFEFSAKKAQKVSDAQGVIIAEAFDEEIANKEYAFQIRGKGLKGMLTFGSVLRWAKEAGKTHIKDYFGRVFAIDELIDNGIKAIVTADMLKGNLWKKSVDAFEQWCSVGEYSDCLWVVGYASKETKLDNKIRCSRQHFTTLFGITEEEAKDAAQATINHLNDIVEHGCRINQYMEKLVPGFRNTVLGKTFDDAAYRPTHDSAYFGRIETEGCFAYVVWEQKPLIASAFCDAEGNTMSKEEIEAMRNLKGNCAAFGQKARHHEAIFARYPGISQAFVHSYLAKSKETCSAVIEASWDLPLSAVLKADTDGDHLAVYLKAIEH